MAEAKAQTSPPTSSAQAEAPVADTNKQAREFLIQAKMYRVMAQVFAVLGLFAAGVLYYGQTKGDFRHIMEHPFMLLVMIIPFLPAIVLSMKAKKFEKNYTKLVAAKAE